MRLDPRESVKTKIVVGFLIVVVVGTAVGSFLVLEVQNQIRTDKQQSLTAEADLQEDTVSSILRDVRGRTTVLANTVDSVRGESQIPDIARATLRDRFRERTRNDEISGAIHLVDDESGDILVSSNPSSGGQSLTSLGYTPPAVSQTEQVVTLKSGDENSWVVYTRTRSGDLLVHETPLSFVENELRGVLKSSRTRIVDAGGVVVYDSSDTDAVGTQHVAGDGVDSPSVQSGLDNPYEASTLALDADESPTGERVISSYSKVAQTQWTVVSYAQPSSLFSTANLVWRDLFVLLAIVGVLLGGYGLLIERPTANRLAELGAVVGELEDGNLDVTVERTRRDELGDLASGLDAMRADLRQEIDEATTAREEAESAREDAEILSEHLQSKAEAYADALEQLAQGDFTTRVDPQSHHDGMASMGETLNTVVADLEATLGEVQSFSDSVAASMEELSASANQIEQASSDVSGTVQDISDGAEDQRDRLGNVTGEMNDLSATVEEVASTSGDVAQQAAETAARSEDGRVAAEQAVTALDEIQVETEDAVAEVDELVDQIEAIGEFTAVISDIAEQTNMLALNANVEAARSTTDGDGFAVVADEIKQLAVEASDRAEEITERVDSIQSQTTTTATEMRAAAERIDDSSDTVQAAIDAMVEVDDLVADVTDGIQDINRAADDQAASTEEVAAMLDEVSTIARDTANDAESVASAAEEQTTSTGEVSRTAEEITQDAADLSDTVAQFVVDPDSASVGDVQERRDATPSRADGGQETE